ncbi:hypothetical protein E8E11_000026 [Didymella keratinophila]|nr:hypothetical protein E8E11_000026 [Didymella keratinophila]
MRSHKTILSDFVTEYTEKERLILIRVYTLGTKVLLGFIRFAYDRDGYSTGGGLKIANFDASLQGYTLRTGGTTKVEEDEQTGYKFYIESTGFKWDITYQQSGLACKLSRMSAQKLEPMMKKTQGRPRTTEAHPWKDVCVVIGAPERTRIIYGLPQKGNRIKADDFNMWLKVTLDINPPQKTIRTSKGDLIRDPHYHGRLYLKGLSFPRGGTSPMLYQYGYDFVTGKTTRDRTSLSNANEESDRVSDIWAAAILEDTSGDSDLLVEYTQLLFNKLNKAGDVMLRRDRNTLREEVAEQVWAHMLTINQDKDGRKAFYYAEEGKEDVKVIEESLNMSPVAISTELWDMLRNFGLCRTPQDELLDRFRIAKTVCVLSTSFAKHVDLMLGGILQASPATKNMQLHFVDGRHLDINVGLFADTWKVHDK